MRKRTVAAAVAAIALLTFFQFPGHTWVQQDTQIYAAILEHLHDPSVLRHDILVQRPHVSFTVYDEVALALRRLTGLGFHEILSGGQLAARAAGIWGLYLMGTAMGLAAGPALLAAAVLSLGALVAGPAVLTIEYEPDPRAFAVPLVLLAVGLLGHRRYAWAGAAAAAAFLVHPPTVYPFWGVYFLLVLWPSRPDTMRARLYALAPLLAAALLLLAASRHQAGVGEAQIFFERLGPAQEKLQRMRANYVWVSVWAGIWMPHYVVLFGAAVLALWRLREKIPFDLRFMLAGLPLVGMISVPLSWLLLERLHWALIPQFQPARALLWVVLAATFLATAAGLRAAACGRYAEAFAWLLLPFLVPANTNVAALPDWRRAGVVVGLAALAVLAARAAALRRRWAAAGLAAAALAGFCALPWLARVRNYPRLHTPELAELAAWARAATPRDAVFLFPDAGRDTAPGVFRARALRAVYVDWKGGGQVNYLRELGEQWWRRWQAAGMGRFRPADLPRYPSLGIDYVVLPQTKRLPGRAPVFENRSYVAYRLR